MRRTLLALLIALHVLSCQMNKADMNIIPEGDFVKLLVDMHITDAMAMNHDINRSFGELDSTLLYRTVLKEHGYTYQQMKNTFEYYTDRPDKYVKVYNKVFAELSKRSDQAKEAYSSIQSSRTFQLWRSKEPRFNIMGDTLDYPEPFDIAVDTTGTFVLVAEAKLSTADESVNPVLEAYFYDPDNDTPDSRIYIAREPIIKSDHNRPREYSFIKEMNNPRYSRMRIIIPSQENTDSVFFKELELRNLRVSLKNAERTK
ncbi:MAG: DUF4296 domain-containing protein [Bacteroidales bacterium]|nr:DUF4296 domain-containing protein [Bacteroidales bacterium]